MVRSIIRSSNISERVISALRSSGRLVSPTTGGGVFNSSIIIGIESLLPYLISY
jgi:hypothetical protein